jgi:hypothetical protein
VTEVPVPVPFGSGKPAQYLVARLFGELTLYPNPIADPDRVLDIGYALFSARASALGLALEGGGEVSGGVGHVGVFQLTLSDDRLPVQPFLTVVGDVIARLGRLRLDAIDVTLPERERSAQPGAPDSGDWYALIDPAQWVPVRVTLECADKAIATVASAAVDRQAVYQDVFRLDAPSEDHARHRVTLTGALAEWSLDALGFLAAFLYDLAASQGITSPLILNAASEEPGKR